MMKSILVLLVGLYLIAFSSVGFSQTCNDPGNVVKDGSFESGNLACWTPVNSPIGDVSIVSSLSAIAPRAGQKMVMLTTGVKAIDKKSSYIRQQFQVTDQAKYISLRYNVISEEPKGDAISEFNDAFKCTLGAASGGGSDRILVDESVNKSKWERMPGTIDFGSRSGMVSTTNWKFVSYDISAFINQSVTLTCVVSDGGDNLSDTAALIDSIKVTATPESDTTPQTQLISLQALPQRNFVGNPFVFTVTYPKAFGSAIILMQDVLTRELVPEEKMDLATKAKMSIPDANVLCDQLTNQCTASKEIQINTVDGFEGIRRFKASIMVDGQRIESDYVEVEVLKDRQLVITPKSGITGGEFEFFFLSSKRLAAPAVYFQNPNNTSEWLTDSGFTMTEKMEPLAKSYQYYVKRKINTPGALTGSRLFKVIYYDYGVAKPSNIAEIFVKNQGDISLQKPVMVYPSEGTKVRKAQDLTIAWQPVPFAQRYKVYLACKVNNTTTPSDVILNYTLVDYNWVLIFKERLPDDGKCYFSVSPVSDFAANGPATVVNFTTEYFNRDDIKISAVPVSGYVSGTQYTFPSDQNWYKFTFVTKKVFDAAWLMYTLSDQNDPNPKWLEHSQFSNEWESTFNNVTGEYTYEKNIAIKTSGADELGTRRFMLKLASNTRTICIDSVGASVPCLSNEISIFVRSRIYIGGLKSGDVISNKIPIKVINNDTNGISKIKLFVAKPDNTEMRTEIPGTATGEMNFDSAMFPNGPLQVIVEGFDSIGRQVYTNKDDKLIVTTNNDFGLSIIPGSASGKFKLSSKYFDPNTTIEYRTYPVIGEDLNTNYPFKEINQNTEISISNDTVIELKGKHGYFKGNLQSYAPIFFQSSISKAYVAGVLYDGWKESLIALGFKDDSAETLVSGKGVYDSVNYGTDNAFTKIDMLHTAPSIENKAAWYGMLRDIFTSLGLNDFNINTPSDTLDLKTRAAIRAIRNASTVYSPGGRYGVMDESIRFWKNLIFFVLGKGENFNRDQLRDLQLREYYGLLIEELFRDDIVNTGYKYSDLIYNSIRSSNSASDIMAIGENVRLLGDIFRLLGNDINNSTEFDLKMKGSVLALNSFARKNLPSKFIDTKVSNMLSKENWHNLLVVLEYYYEKLINSGSVTNSRSEMYALSQKFIQQLIIPIQQQMSLMGTASYISDFEGFSISWQFNFPVGAEKMKFYYTKNGGTEVENLMADQATEISFHENKETVNAYIDAYYDGIRISRSTIVYPPSNPVAFKNFKILQLGDSYSAGPGVGGEDHVESYLNYSESYLHQPRGCFRGKGNYGESYYNYLKQYFKQFDILHGTSTGVDYQSYSCSGAVTHDLLNEYVHEVGKNLYSGYQSTRPDPKYLENLERSLDVWQDGKLTARGSCIVYDNAPVPVPVPGAEPKYNYYWKCDQVIKPQVEFIEKDTDLVLLTIGGNDVFFADLIRDCLIATQASVFTADTCKETAKKAAYCITSVPNPSLGVNDPYPEICQRSNSYADDIASVLVKIREKAPNAKILLIPYPDLLDDRSSDWTLLHNEFPIGSYAKYLVKALKSQALIAVQSLHDDDVKLFDNIDEDFMQHRACPDRSTWSCYQSSLVGKPDDPGSSWIREVALSNAVVENYWYSNQAIIYTFYHPNAPGHAAIGLALAHHLSIRSDKSVDYLPDGIVSEFDRKIYVRYRYEFSWPALPPPFNPY